MIRAAQRLLADRRGVTVVEYGLIAGGITLVIVGAVVGLGADLNSSFFVAADTALQSAGAAAATN
jgi:pilus assembly protein Flp/PilA